MNGGVWRRFNPESNNLRARRPTRGVNIVIIQSVFDSNFNSEYFSRIRSEIGVFCCMVRPMGGGSQHFEPIFNTLIFAVRECAIINVSVNLNVNARF